MALTPAQQAIRQVFAELTSVECEMVGIELQTFTNEKFKNRIISVK